MEGRNDVDCEVHRTVRPVLARLRGRDPGSGRARVQHDPQHPVRLGQEASVFSIAGRVDYVLMPTQQGELDLMHMIPWMGRFRERGISAVFVMNKVTAPRLTYFKQAKAKLVQNGVVIPVDLTLR